MIGPPSATMKLVHGGEEPRTQALGGPPTKSLGTRLGCEVLL